MSVGVQANYNEKTGVYTIEVAWTGEKPKDIEEAAEWFLGHHRGQPAVAPAKELKT